MVGDSRGTKSSLGSPCWPQSFLKTPKCFKMRVLSVEVLHHQFQKPELVSGFFTPVRNASSGGPSRICLASGTPHISAFLALHGLSVLRFYLVASRACARSLPVLMRVSGRLVVVGNCWAETTEHKAPLRDSQVSRSVHWYETSHPYAEVSRRPSRNAPARASEREHRLRHLP